MALLDDLEFQTVAAHTEWELPTATGELAQGKIAGVPARLVGGRPALLVVQAAYADELRKHLGW